MSEIEEIVKNTDKNMREELLSGRDTHQKDDVQAIIKKHIDAAFETVEEKDKKTLYKKLSILFHPDKLQNDPKGLYEILKKHDMVNEPFRIISAHNEKANALNEIASDPIRGTTALVKKLYDMSYVHLTYYKRYYQPFRALANITSWIINIPLILTGVVILIGASVTHGVITFINMIHDFSLNLLTGGKLKQTIADERNSHPEQYEKAHDQYFEGIRQTMILQIELMNEEDLEKEQLEQKINQLNDMSLDQFRNFFIAQQVLLEGGTCSFESFEEEHKAAILKQIQINKLKMVATVLFRSIFDPLPEGFFSAAFSLLIARPLTLLLSPVFLLATSAIEAAKKLNGIFILATIGVLAGIKLATLAIVNAPLYLLDLTRFIANGIANFCSSKQEPEFNKQQEPVDIGNHSPTTMRRLMGGTTKVSSRDSILVEPAQKGTSNTLFSPAPIPSSQDPVVNTLNTLD
ncbi:MULTISPECIES: hypothetical protein [unclassified Legionella]|uniref:hypothetical protein n=1 Tax=unclassified Legionella TaxID=2622702 RepID=UPI0010567CD9|nr:MULTISPECIES: hypothetical protein [unclassified Legionella]MDI9818870.1 hypothetical protein [Legionella sp. PL877]